MRGSVRRTGGVRPAIRVVVDVADFADKPPGQLTPGRKINHCFVTSPHTEEKWAADSSRRSEGGWELPVAQLECRVHDTPAEVGAPPAAGTAGRVDGAWSSAARRRERPRMGRAEGRHGGGDPPSRWSGPAWAGAFVQEFSPRRCWRERGASPARRGPACGAGHGRPARGSRGSRGRCRAGGSGPTRGPHERQTGRPPESSPGIVCRMTTVSVSTRTSRTTSRTTRWRSRTNVPAAASHGSFVRRAEKRRMSSKRRAAFAPARRREGVTRGGSSTGALRPKATHPRQAGLRRI